MAVSTILLSPCITHHASGVDVSNGMLMVPSPTIKEEIKRNFKDLSTSARFGMFRAKKKLLRKAEI